MPFDERCCEMTKSRTSDYSSKNEKKKRSILTSIFSRKGKNRRGCDAEIPGAKIVFDLDQSSCTPRRNFLDANPGARKSLSGRNTGTRIEGLDLSMLERQRRKAGPQVQNYKIYVGTWNVGGRCPNNGLNLEDFLQVEGPSDIYVLGFQEIVPLNAGNVLVIEDNEPAAKWLALIGQALNKPRDVVDDFAMDNDHSSGYGKAADFKSPGGGGGSSFFQRSSLKVLSKNYRANTALVKTCNCRPELAGFRCRPRKLIDHFEGLDDKLFWPESPRLDSPERGGGDSYCLVASKQMVGIFLSVWVRSELVRHVGHVRVTTVGRGIMGCLGNKGCIALSMSVHRTSFSFVCSHLTSGEKEGDELKRNADVAEILRSTQFPRICTDPGRRIPEKIIDHDHIVWFGDLNYRIALSYEEAITLVEDNNWDALLGKDQLILEREAGRVFYGWKEGKIYFAPTYKYTQNSDVYAGEMTKSKKKRRTPSWCDRILWYGNGIEQLQYVRGELRFSDHRPVCAVFKVEVELPSANASSIFGRCFRKGFSNVVSSKVPFFDVTPKQHSFYEY